MSSHARRDPPPKPATISERMPAPGTLLCDRYRLGPLVGKGGAAAVYRGTDEVLHETVAIKVLLPDGIMNNPRAAHLSFRAEAVSAMRLSHPRILRVYNYEFQAPWEFLIMEFVAGENLAKLVKTLPHGRLSPLETVDVGLGCLEALEAAHAEGVIHNDLTPSNVLLTRAGTIKLCDFGLAHFTAEEVPGRTITAVGTPAFMSPERITGSSGDARSDLYSLAATLYLLGNGTTLFGNGAEAYYHHVHTPTPASRHLPAALHELLCVASEKDPGARFQSAEEMRLALAAVRRLVAGSSPSSEVPAQPGYDEDIHHARGSRARAGGDERDASAEPDSEITPTDLDHALERSCEILIVEDSAAHLVAGGAPMAPAYDPRGMVEVPDVILSSLYGGVHAVKGFLLDRTPVTNERYAEFLRTTGETPPAHWLGGRPPARLAGHPVVGVSREQALRYAVFRGKRLPTALEWEAAARGSDGRRFPWGDAYEPSRCHGPERSVGTTAPVGAHPEGASGFGALDLVGNVWEWTVDDARVPHPETGYAWVFGGSFKHRCDPDARLARTAVAIGKSYEYLGFRCAADEGKHARR
jgi:serine/threonine-protein kinase